MANDKMQTELTFDIDLALREQTAMVAPEELFLVCDENVSSRCLPVVQQTLSLPADNILVLPSGEDTKTVSTVEHIWRFLVVHHATRHSMLICLGGGVITDMGGFAAATYMRGIQCLNIPTTLLGMVDASAGGKTGIDFDGIKNLVGVFCMPKHTIIYPPFLSTLPPREFLSGWAEMVKHTLIASPLQVAALRAFDLHGWFAGGQKDKAAEEEQLADLISRSIEVKNYIVESDPDEKGMRQTLNFGHTVGHALEALFLQKQQNTTAGSALMAADSGGEAHSRTLPHGYAVMYGMVAELYLSHLLYDFPEKDILPIVEMMKEYYGKPVCPCSDYSVLLELMRHDKKNIGAGQITFTLLHSIGNYRLGCTCSDEQICEALDFLFNC